MSDFQDFFDRETVSKISELIEDKMPLLNKLPEFKEKDKNFAMAMENFENSLSEDSLKKFNDVMKLNYQIDEYYFTLAYFLGIKHGKQIVEV